MNFYELAKELELFLAQKNITEPEMAKLYDDIEQIYISVVSAAIVDRHPQWCVLSHQRAAEIYLYQNRPQVERGKD